MRAPGEAAAYIVAARRSALGRVGGLHRNRRLEDLAAPIVTAALADAGVEPADVDEIVIGNASQGGNPARLIALAAGLPLTAPALSIDRQCASGLDAIIHAVRSIAAGDAQVVVAGGAESLSTAPWRVARPKSVHHTPHFIGLEPTAMEQHDVPQPIQAAELLAEHHQISRAAQDAYAMKSHLRADTAREARRFVGEIVPLRGNRDEARDESAIGASLDDLEASPAYCPPNGTLTLGNTSQPHDGAAIVVIVSQAMWQRLGKPPALKLVGSAAEGVAPEHEAEAPIAAWRKLDQRLNGYDRAKVRAVELGESSAAQAIATMTALGIDESILNADGGAVVRGHPLGAAGAVLVVRLFSRLVRRSPDRREGYGTAVLGAAGGLGLAAMFEAV
jgi:acetyl-CoA C-acetyltransferase